MITYAGFERNFTYDNTPFLSTVKECFEKISKTDDILPINVFCDDLFDENSHDFKNSINLCISGENIYFTMYYDFKNSKLLKYNFVLKKYTKIDLEKYFRAFIHRLSPLLKNTECLHRPKLLHFATNLCKKDSKNFAILTNSVKSENILNFPYFFHSHLDKFQELIDIKRENRYAKKRKFCAFAVGADVKKR